MARMLEPQHYPTAVNSSVLLRLSLQYVENLSSCQWLIVTLGNAERQRLLLLLRDKRVPEQGESAR